MIVKLLDGKLECRNWLDIGTGDGYTIRLVNPKGSIAGIDPDPEMGPLAESRGIEFKRGSAYHIPYDDNSFEVVTCIEVLEHLERPVEAIKELRRVAADGSRVVVTTPVPSATWRLLWWGWTKLGPGKRWETTPHVSDLHLHDGNGAPGLSTMLEEAGFRVESMSTCNMGMIAGVRASPVGS